MVSVVSCGVNHGFMPIKIRALKAPNIFERYAYIY